MDDEQEEIEDTLRNLERLPDALTNLREYAEIKHYSGAVWAALAQQELKEQNQKEAQAAFRRALKNDSKNVAALRFLSDQAYDAEDYEGAAPYLQRLSEVLKNDCASWMKYADTLVKTREIHGACEAYRQASKCKHADANAFKMHAAMLIELKRYDDAASIYKQAEKTFGIELAAELATVDATTKELNEERQSAKKQLTEILTNPQALSNAKTLEVTDFEKSILAVDWLSKCGKELTFGKPLKSGDAIFGRTLEWIDPQNGSEVTIAFSEMDINMLPTADDAEPVLAERQGAFQDILRANPEWSNTLDETEERLKAIIFPAIESAAEKLFKKVSKQLAKDEADEDELEYKNEQLLASLELAKYDAVVTASIISTMMHHDIAVPPDFAIRWMCFAQGYWPCELEFDRQTPEDYAYDGEYVRELTENGDESIWKVFRYLIW